MKRIAAALATMLLAYALTGCRQGDSGDTQIERESLPPPPAASASGTSTAPTSEAGQSMIDQITDAPQSALLKSDGSIDDNILKNQMAYVIGEFQRDDGKIDRKVTAGIYINKEGLLLAPFHALAESQMRMGTYEIVSPNKPGEGRILYLDQAVDPSADVVLLKTNYKNSSFVTVPIYREDLTHGLQVIYKGASDFEALKQRKNPSRMGEIITRLHVIDTPPLTQNPDNYFVVTPQTPMPGIPTYTHQIGFQPGFDLESSGSLLLSRSGYLVSFVSSTVPDGNPSSNGYGPHTRALRSVVEQGIKMFEGNAKKAQSN